MDTKFEQQLQKMISEQEYLLHVNNVPVGPYNGFVQRFKNPILTPAHTPLFWRYDMNIDSNPYLIERFGINSIFNSGAIKWNGKYLIVARVEGYDRKSFFAIAESANGIDHFKFWEYPVQLPDIDERETNVYDMRLTAHEDGWIYGLFCSERKNEKISAEDPSNAIASTGIVRTKDFIHWERFPNLKARSHQRNVVLHPEFVDNKYALYTRPQDGFIEAGQGGGISWALIDDITNAVIRKEQLVDGRQYHTIKEAKNGEGPAPIKTSKGWLHLAHGVRHCAAGLRYVLYLFLSDLHEPQKVIASPAGYFMAPEGDERVGDVPNVLFSNGWIADDDGKVFIYYASSDTRMHVATSTIERLLDYCLHTKPDGLRSESSVNTLTEIISKNNKHLSLHKNSAQVEVKK